MAKKSIRERVVQWMLKAVEIDDQLRASTWDNSDISMQSFNTLSREGYESVATVYRCVNLIAKTGAAILLGVFEDGEDGPELISPHEFTDLMRRPNPLQSRTAFVKYWITCLLLGGRSFIWANVLDNGEIAELWVIPPNDMNVQLNQTFGVMPSFTWYWNGTTLPLNSEHVMYTWFPNPRDFMEPMSPLKAAAQEVDLSNKGQAWNLSLLANYAKPPFVVTLDKDSEMTLKNEHVDDIKKALRDEYNGYQNAGRAPVFRIPGLQLTPYGWNPQDMDWLKGLSAQDVRIANVYDIPPEFIGQQATYDNRKEAVRALYDQAVLPVMKLLSDELTNWTIVGLMENEFVDIIRETIQALQEDRDAVAKRIVGLVGSGVITRNEGRLDMKMKKSDDPMADVLTVTKEVATLGIAGANVGTVDITEEGAD